MPSRMPSFKKMASFGFKKKTAKSKEMLVAEHTPVVDDMAIAPAPATDAIVDTPEPPLRSSQAPVLPPRSPSGSNATAGKASSWHENALAAIQKEIDTENEEAASALAAGAMKTGLELAAADGSAPKRGFSIIVMLLPLIAAAAAISMALLTNA